MQWLHYRLVENFIPFGLDCKFRPLFNLTQNKISGFAKTFLSQSIIIKQRIETQTSDLKKL